MFQDRQDYFLAGAGSAAFFASGLAAGLASLLVASALAAGALAAGAAAGAALGASAAKAETAKAVAIKAISCFIISPCDLKRSKFVLLYIQRLVNALG